MIELIRFLQAERALVHSPVLPLSLGAGVSRGFVIMLINAAVVSTVYSPAMLAGAAAVVLACHLACLHLTRIKAYALVERLQADLRGRLIHRLLHVDASFFFARERGELYNVIANDIATVAASSVRFLNSLQAGVVIVFCMFYLFWLSAIAGLTALATLALGALACMAWDRGGRARVAEALRQGAAFFDRLEDTLHGFKEVRLNARRRDALEAHVVRLLSGMRSLSVAAERHFSLSNTTAQTFMFLQLGLVVFLLPAAAGLDSTTAFQALTVMLFTYGPVDKLLGSYPAISRARVSLARLRALEAALDRAPASAAPARLPTPAPSFETIRLEGLVVSLTDDASPATEGEDARFVVGPVDLTIRRGEIVFIHGGNGSGKTTLLSALCGLRRAEAGRILLDGEVADTRDGGAYRALFSAVFADFHLFRHLYGLSEPERNRLAALIAELDLPARVEVANGEFKSLALSAGQRRRLALSVALAENRPILLCDEFAADQDPAHRAFFYEELLPKLRAQGRTIIAITHDENRFHLCDQLIKMDQGRIVAVQRGRFAAEPELFARRWHETAAE